MLKITLYTVVGALMLAFTGLAHAVPIPWTLANVTFDDGATATGSFIFDADTTTYSSVSIVTSPAGTSYDTSEVASVLGSDALGLNLIDNFGLPDLTGQRILNLDFLLPLTNLGGVVNIVVGFPSFEGTCGAPDCSSGSLDRQVITGGQVVSSVPEPATALLLAVGVAGIGYQRRKLKV